MIPMIEYLSIIPRRGLKRFVDFLIPSLVGGVTAHKEGRNHYSQGVQLYLLHKHGYSINYKRKYVYSTITLTFKFSFNSN